MTQQPSQTAEQAAAAILEAFRNPDTLPAKLSQLILAGGDRHADRYSWNNQFLVLLAGYSDAAGFKQWQAYGRQVRKGERSFCILAPITKSFPREETDPVTGQTTTRRVTYIAGWKDVRVFGLEQTDIVDEDKWAARQKQSEEERAAIARVESGPFAEIAHRMGLGWKADGTLAAIGALGMYQHGVGITLATANLSTAAHELVHAVDDKLGTLTVRYGQQPDNEIVAELGGAIVLTMMGLTADADLGGCYEYLRSYAKGDVVAAACKLLNRTLDCVKAITAALDGSQLPWEEAAA